MRIDVYTKTILTLIALLLTVIALGPILQPQAAMAQGNLGGVQFSYSGGAYLLFDSRTGDIWNYDGNGGLRQHFKVTQLGKDLER